MQSLPSLKQRNIPSASQQQKVPTQVKSVVSAVKVSFNMILEILYLKVKSVR